VLCVAALLALGAGLAGCEKQVREANSASTQPTTSSGGTDQPPATQSAPGEATTASLRTRPSSETQPTPVFISIDGQGAEIPPTKLRLHRAQPGKAGARAELFSAIPRSDLLKWKGNELYLDMTLDGVAADGKLDGATWQFKSTRSGKSDSANGIFLHGQTVHLQPFDAAVTFERRGEKLVALIAGQFRAYEDGTPDALAPFVAVQGEVPVEIDPHG
jgi:hypothetical protein